MTGVTFVTSHWDADDADVEVTLEKRTQAFKYGSSLIPIGGFDMEGLKMRAPVSLTVLGYVRTEEVPRTLFIGDPYGVSGGESRQASAAISALSHGLHIEDCAALCKFVKSKDADPLLGAIFPLIEDEAQPAGPPCPPSVVPTIWDAPRRCLVAGKDGRGTAAAGSVRCGRK